MELHVDDSSGPITRVRLVGRLDAAGADRIDTRFTAAVVAAGKPAIVDLGGVDFLASMGIRLLISAARGASLKGAKVALFGATDAVQDVFEQTALAQIMPIVETEAAAVAAVAL